MDIPTILQPDDTLEHEYKENVKLQAKWEADMSEFTLTRRHKKVVVLILYWDKVKESYLDVGDEIRRLIEVFETRYHYKTIKRSLNGGGTPQVTLNLYLAEAASEVDCDDSLLIVYYAGHGNPNDNGELLLTGGNHNPEDKHPGAGVDSVVWRRAEALVHTVEKTDVLLIFDCCSAGNLCGTYRRTPLAARSFEFLGATAADAFTRVPGKHSFTSALIWALEKRAGDIFTTSELYSTILEAPDFPVLAQTPVLTERGEHSFTRLMLGPLLSTEQDERPRTPSNHEAANLKEFGFTLNLQFNYDAIPSIEDVGRMSTIFKDFMRSKEISAKHINWGGIHRKNINVHPTVAWAAAKFKYLASPKRLPRLDIQGTGFSANLEVEVPVGLRTPSSVSSERSVRSMKVCKTKSVRPGRSGASRRSARVEKHK